MSTFRCPICDRTFTPGDSMPFCSPRCKRIDQGRWLGEEYGLPIEEAEEFHGDTRVSDSPPAE